MAENCISDTDTDTNYLYLLYLSLQYLRYSPTQEKTYIVVNLYRDGLK